MGNPIFLDEGGDGADEIGPFEGQRRAAQLPGQVQAVPDLALGGGIDVFGSFARRLDINGVPGAPKRLAIRAALRNRAAA